MKISDIIDAFKALQDELHIEVVPHADSWNRFTIKNENITITSDYSANLGNNTKISFIISKKDNFTGTYVVQNQFAWNFENDEDLKIFIEKMKKELCSPIGPFEFSKRSTYVKKEGIDSRAFSGNFVLSAKVVKVVGLDNRGNVSDGIEDHKKDAWFLVYITSPRGDFQILYNLEQWWPTINKRHGKDLMATGSLVSTGGRLLTMHDKFVVDLAVKIYNGG